MHSRTQDNTYIYLVYFRGIQPILYISLCVGPCLFENGKTSNWGRSVSRIKATSGARETERPKTKMVRELHSWHLLNGRVFHRQLIVLHLQMYVLFSWGLQSLRDINCLFEWKGHFHLCLSYRGRTIKTK